MYKLLRYLKIDLRNKQCRNTFQFANRCIINFNYHITYHCRLTYPFTYCTLLLFIEGNNFLRINLQIAPTAVIDGFLSPTGTFYDSNISVVITLQHPQVLILFDSKCLSTVMSTTQVPFYVREQWNHVVQVVI